MRLSFLFLFLLTNYGLLAQTGDLVEGDSIAYAVHKANIGRVTFMDKVIPIESYQASDFLTEFELKENADLNIRVFLGNSLTNYLHSLSPGSTVDELTKNGNYQFSFLVDDQQIYTENLNAGAGTMDSKNKRTVFRVPLISTSNEDSWGRFLWNRFLINGGQESFAADGEHLLRIQIRPYLNLAGVVTGGVIAEGEIKIVVPQKHIDEKLVSVQPVNPSREWSISGDKIDTGKLEDLNRKIALQVYKDITSIIVIKDGKILIEEYFNGAGRSTLHDTRSVGKSFAGALLGLAIKDGYIRSEMQTLDEFYDLTVFPNYDPRKGKITLRDLLTMSSALDGSDMEAESPGNEENMYPAKNWVEFTLSLPLDKAKAAARRWDYFTAGVVVLGDIINRSVPGGLENYADKKLFKPVGISNCKWQFTPQKVPNTAGGLQLSSLDYAKFGQLYKNNGIWNGKQVLTYDWVNRSLSHQMTISEGEYYGYLFWNKTYHVDGVDYEVYYSSGNGGNKVFIFNDKPFVIVLTSTAYNQPYAHSQVDRILTKYLIPAIMK